MRHLTYLDYSNRSNYASASVSTKLRKVKNGVRGPFQQTNN